MSLSLIRDDDTYKIRDKNVKFLFYFKFHFLSIGNTCKMVKVIPGIDNSLLITEKLLGTNLKCSSNTKAVYIYNNDSVGRITITYNDTIFFFRLSCS